MKGTPAVQIMGDAEGSRVLPSVGFVRLSVDLPVFDETLRIVADVPDQRLQMSDVIPLAYHICDRIVAASARHSQAVGEPASCRKGCSACCEQPVLISVPEAFRLITDIGSLPDDRKRRVNTALADAEKRTAAPGPPPNACSLLAEQACSIYAFRPCVCRTFLATSPPKLCDTHDARIMPVPIAVSSALGLWAAELEDDTSAPVLMSGTLSWCDDNHARSQRTWPGPQMVRQLFDILSKMALEAR